MDEDLKSQVSKFKGITKIELEDTLYHEDSELFYAVAESRKFGIPRLYKKAIKKYSVNPKMFFFESNLARQYTGNPRYIYERMLELYPDFTYVWSYNGDKNHIPGNPIVVERSSEKFYKYLAQSSVIINNTNFPNWNQRPETFCLETWHGTPYKKLHWDRTNKSGKHSSPAFYVKSRNWDALLSPNHYSTERFKSAFRYSGKILEFGYPANDIFYNNEKYSLKREEIRNKLNINSEALVYLYAPTWRDGTHLGNSMFKFDLLFDPVTFLENAPENSVLLIRSHHMSEATEALKDLEGRAIDVSQWDDAIELMCASDILITDYSSIVFDWYCSKKPVIYYVPDLEDYETKLRGTYFDIREKNCGILCQSENELYENLDVRDAPFYEDFYEEFCSLHDGNSSDKIIEYLLDVKPIPESENIFGKIQTKLSSIFK